MENVILHIKHRLDLKDALICIRVIFKKLFDKSEGESKNCMGDLIKALNDQLKHTEECLTIEDGYDKGQ